MNAFIKRFWRPRLTAEFLALIVVRQVCIVLAASTIRDPAVPDNVALTLYWLVVWIVPAAVLVWIVAREMKRSGRLGKNLSVPVSR